MPKDDTKLFGDNLIELNRRLLQMRYPYNDTQFAHMCLHIMVGQLPNVLMKRYNIYGSRMDLRVHGTVLSPSGTNKGSVFTYMEGVCKTLSENSIPMKFKIMGKFTDSSLVGTPDTKNEKVELIDEETGEVATDSNGKALKETVKVEDHIFGALHPTHGNNILAWSEGSQVLDVKTINLNQSTMNILQQCMNPLGTPDNLVSKSTGLGEISFNTTCSIFMTTYKPYSLNEKVISTGFLQRQIVIIREPTPEQSRDVSRSATDGLERAPPQKEAVDELVRRLIKVNEFVGTVIDKEFDIPEDVRTLMKDYQDQFHSNIRFTNILVRAKLGEFVRRWAVNVFYNIVFHHALLSLRNNVTIEDVLYAGNFLLPIWKGYSSFLENALLMDKKEMEDVSRQYSHIIIVYNRLLKKYNERKKDMSDEELDEWEEVDGYIRRDALVGQVALDWAQSIDSVNDLFVQIEESLFDGKDVLSVPPEERPEKITRKWLADAPKVRWIRLKQGALRTINVK